jgi:putative DNA primase/helicase
VNVDESEPLQFSIEELRAASPRCTDAGNADAFVARHGQGFRFVLGWSRWIAWNGQRWELDGAEGRVVQAALLSAREDYATVLLAIRDLEESLRKAQLEASDGSAEKADRVKSLEGEIKLQRYLLKWHEQSHNVSRLHACRTLLESSLTIEHTSLDCHPWLLNAQNGTIDLRTGSLRPAERDDFLTQICPVDYDPDAQCPVWETFLSTSLAQDQEMMSYLQRLVGYSATGLTVEHVLLFFHGEGNNGKSTFFTAVLNTLGEDYACAAPPDLLFLPRGASSPHPTEVASLYGKRVASCAELGEGQQLDEAKVKRLTGGDPIRCRRMNEDWWTFRPSHTLFLGGNHKPRIAGSDHGIWRRVRLIPWTVIILQQCVDKDLSRKIETERAGILAWIVRGAVEWARVGFADPATVTAATAAFRSESDVLGQFLASSTVADPGGRVSQRTLRERYESWCKDCGYETLGGRRFNDRLRSLGAVECTVREAGAIPRRGWRGIRIKSDLETIADSEPVDAQLS